MPPPGDRDLSTFPQYRLTRARTLYRAHRRDLSPWWFSSSGEGRFDLEAPRGTCYLAFDPCTAVRETAGTTLVQLGVVSAEFANTRVVSKLRAPATKRLANTCREQAASYGLTRELGTTTPYTVPREWAAAFAKNFAGIVYQSRFTTGASQAIALFSNAGRGTWEYDTTPTPYTAAARQCGIRVAPPVRSVTIIQPPQ
nr:RES family NAD+ phosphorylase [Hoyosella altamirensis]